jgi:hypothetical protein
MKLFHLHPLTRHKHSPGCRHGEDAAHAATQGLQVANDLMTITLNWFRLTGRALISHTAHGSARDFLRAHVANLSLE